MTQLDVLLEDWHRWSQGYQYAGGISSSPIFRNAKSSRYWDPAEKVLQEMVDAESMEAVNFHVFELPPDQRTAIQLHARNLATGRCVWTSARLPQDPMARAEILQAAKEALGAKLSEAGIL